MDTASSKAPIPLRQRRFHVFLSHAHLDTQTVVQIRNWLAMAGLNVWYDAEQVAGGSLFPSALAGAIGESQSMIVAISKAALDSGWVEEESNQGLVHSQNFKPFPLIPVRLENCELPSVALARSAIDAIGGTLSGIEASRLLTSIHGLPDATPPADATRQILQAISAEIGDPPDPLEKVRCPALYMSFGWRDSGNEPLLRKSVCRALDGFFLLGDAIDHPHTDPERVAAIMGGCEAHVVVVPVRGTGQLSDHEYKSLFAEIKIGSRVGIPQHFILEDGVAPPGLSAASVVTVTPNASSPAWSDPIDQWVESLRQAGLAARRPHYVFVATDYEDRVMKDHVVRHIARVTGLPCLKGSDFGGKMPSRKIELAIRAASLVIVNVVSGALPSGKPDVNWNTCIEAGIALGAGKPVLIVARRAGADTWAIRDLPFMIRDNSIATYADDAELVALVHQTCRRFRRRVLNGQV